MPEATLHTETMERVKRSLYTKTRENLLPRSQIISPISLSNYLLKGLEKLLVEQMDLALEDHPIHKNQHGFQRGLSTETAISKTVNYIEKHINSGREVLGVFLDIPSSIRHDMSKAYKS